MPNVAGSTRPLPAASSRQTRQVYRCCRCDRTFTQQLNQFPKAQSTLYHGNEGYLPWCKHCVDELFVHYTKELGSEKEAVKRMCLKFDIYWNEGVFSKMPLPAPSSTVIRTYISRVNSYQYRGKTYDDSIDESVIFKGVPEDDTEPCEYIEGQTEAQEIPAESKLFWGKGFTYKQYSELDERYLYWSQGRKFETREEEGLYRQIAMTDWQITKAAQIGTKTEALLSAFNTLLSNANIKSKTGQGAPGTEDKRPLGVKIRDYENEKPIPEPSEEFKDVDGIVKYISTWYLGHLCKMLKIKNSYSRLYEKEIQKYRVERPEYDGEDDEGVFDSVFGGD